LSEYNADWLLQFVLGGLFIVFVTAARFQGVTADRSYTTFFRYAVATTYFVCAYLGVYYVIATSAAWLMGSFTSMPLGDFLSSPAWVGLALVALVPRVPVLSTLDHAFRLHAAAIGGMPNEALRLRDKMRQVRCTLPESVAREIHYSVLRRGLDLGDMRSVPDNTVHSLFTHASEIKHLLDHCARQRHFARFFADNAREFHALAARYDALMFKSTRTVDAIGGLNDLVDRTSGNHDNWESLGELVETEVYAGKAGVLDPAISTSRVLLGNLRDDTRSFIDDALLLIARLTMYHRWSERGRVALLAEFGLNIPPAKLPRYGSLSAVFALVLASMFFGTMTFGAAGEQTAREIAGVLFMVPTMFIVALFCAIYPKQYFSFANTNLYGRPPYLFYVAAAFAAGILAFVVGLTFRVFIYQDAVVALDKAFQNSPWLLVSMTVAGVMAALVQDRPMSKSTGGLRSRCRDAVTLSLALGISSAVVQWILPYTQKVPSNRPIIWGIGISMLIGACIGYFVPARFRAPSARTGNAQPRTFTETMRAMLRSKQPAAVERAS
jgi:hypothetical protein